MSLCSAWWLSMFKSIWRRFSISTTWIAPLFYVILFNSRIYGFSDNLISILAVSLAVRSLLDRGFCWKDFAIQTYCFSGDRSSPPRHGWCGICCFPVVSWNGNSCGTTHPSVTTKFSSNCPPLFLTLTPKESISGSFAAFVDQFVLIEITDFFVFCQVIHVFLAFKSFYKGTGPPLIRRRYWPLSLWRNVRGMKLVGGYWYVLSQWSMLGEDQVLRKQGRMGEVK